MTLCSNNEELSSGCERYLAGVKGNGESASESQHIDELVAIRNGNAYDLTNVNVTYRYYEDNAQLYGLSKCFDIIFSEVANSTSTSPDIYCNFMTDMVCTSIKGSFANLNATSNNAGSCTYENYFNFEHDGYMSDYMESLSLSADKMYVIASDYFLDLHRAFYVIPVNVALFDLIAAQTTEDLNSDGKIDINDIYEEVYAGDWTYDRLATLSTVIFAERDSIEGIDINDLLGFGLANSSITSSALMYSSSIEIIEKSLLAYENEFYINYKEDNESIEDFAQSLLALVNSLGVDVVASVENEPFPNMATPLAVRERFNRGSMLFGGIVLAGTFEHDVYQQMKDNGNLALLPVPVYEKDNQHIYSTQIHYTGRAGGISAKTDNFEQCTAFLQYQSEHSTEVVNEYYSSVFGSANVDMMSFIRSRVNRGTDMYVEEMLPIFSNSSPVLYDDSKLHFIIRDQSYQVPNLYDHYKTYLSLKGTALMDLINIYKNFPDWPDGI